jgi:ADP-ribose pyrophosphatase YjhB (NUDIX family)
VLEETGLDVQIGRVAFVLETTGPDGDQRLIEIIFLASGTPVRNPPSGSLACGRSSSGRRDAAAGPAAAHRWVSARPAPHSPAGNRALPLALFSYSARLWMAIEKHACCGSPLSTAL